MSTMGGMLILLLFLGAPAFVAGLVLYGFVAGNRRTYIEQKQTQGVTREELESEAKTQQEAVDSVRESLLSRVNLNGYYNFRFSADGSPTPNAFQQHHLGVLMGKPSSPRDQPGAGGIGGRGACGGDSRRRG